MKTFGFGADGKKRDWMGVHGEADGDEDDDDSVGKAWFIDLKRNVKTVVEEDTQWVSS